MRARLAATLIALLAAGACPGVARAATADVPGGSVWLPYWRMPVAVDAVVRARSAFATASPFWFDARACGRIVRNPGAADTRTVARLHAAGLAVVPTVTASGLWPPAAVRCFADPDARAAHVALLLRVLRSGAYDGIDLDYEHLARTRSVPTATRVAAAFSALVASLCPRVRALGKRCVVTVMPRTGDARTIWHGILIPGVYDYAALGAAADRLRVMAYDDHTSRTRPGPMAGFGWVRRVAAYVARTTDVGRAELGIPTYGRDWSALGTATLAGDGARQLARHVGVAPRFDPVARESTFAYRAGGVTHRIWFSDARAVAERTALAARLGFAGAAYWAAGLEQPGTWTAVARARRRATAAG